MRHGQQARWFCVSLRVIRPNHHRVFDVVVDGVKFAASSIDGHPGNESYVRLRPDDLPAHLASCIRSSLTKTPVVTYYALPIRVGHHHDVVNRIDRNADECRMGIDDGTDGWDVAA